MRKIVYAQTLVVALALAASATPPKRPLPAWWRDFQAAVARGDKEKVARLTAFPLKHPALKVSTRGELSREEFLRKYDLVFTAGVKRQVTLGSPHLVTREDVRAARDEDLDPCGEVGEYVIELPAGTQVDYNNDDEAFLRLVFKRVKGRFVLHRVIGCN